MGEIDGDSGRPSGGRAGGQRSSGQNGNGGPAATTNRGVIAPQMAARRRAFPSPRSGQICGGAAEKYRLPFLMFRFDY